LPSDEVVKTQAGHVAALAARDDHFDLSEVDVDADVGLAEERGRCEQQDNERAACIHQKKGPPGGGPFIIRGPV